MLYIYYGSDTQKARAKVHRTIAALRNKQPDALYMRVYGDEFLSQNPLELTASQGLFKSEYIVLLDSVLTNAESQKMFSDIVSVLADAPHIFLLLQESIAAPLLKRIEKHATKVEAFTAKAEESLPRQNVFAITDALLARNKNMLWSELQMQLQSGKAAEEIAGVLFWGAKSIVLGRSAKSAEEAGLKAYPFQKARAATAKFSKSEAYELMRALATAQARAFKTGAPLALILEDITLSV